MKFTLLIPALLLTASSFAQQSKTDSVKPAPSIAAKEDFADDWADLRHYAAENAVLPTPARDEHRVVFLGSSIFERWKVLVPE